MISFCPKGFSDNKELKRLGPETPLERLPKIKIQLEYFDVVERGVVIILTPRLLAEYYYKWLPVVILTCKDFIV